MSLLHQYRIDIYTDNETAVVMNPLNDRLLKAWERQDGGGFRQIIKSTLIFNKTDFAFFAAVAGQCEVYKIIIYQKLSGPSDPFEEWFSGTVTVSDAKYDLARGICELKVHANDGYTCFYKNIKKKFNILALGRDIRLTNEAIFYQTVICADIVNGAADGTHVVDCIPTGASNRFYKIKQHDETLFIPGEVIVQTTWIREKWNKAGPPPSDGTWSETDVADPGYFRFPTELGVIFLQNPPASYSRIVTYANFLDQDGVDNGRILSDVLIEMFDAFNCQVELRIKSDFLNINYIGDNPGNAAYTRASERLSDLLVFQRSDIMRYDAQENASIMEYSVEDFINIFVKIFNMTWGIKRVGGIDYFILEHVSFFQNIPQFDWSAKQVLNNKKAFEFSLEDIPKSETFTFLNGRKATKFGPAVMEYTSSCTDPKSVTVAHAFTDVSTDFVGLVQNEDPNDNLEGIFIMSCFVSDDFYNMFQDYGELNGAMSWHEIIRYYWKHNIYGDFKLIQYFALDETVMALSLKRRMKQSSVGINISTADERAFDPAFLQTTPLGDGQPQSAQFDTATGVLTVQINY